MRFRATTLAGLKATDALIVPLFEDATAQIRGLPRNVQAAYDAIVKDDAVRLPYHHRAQALERGDVGRLVVVNAGKRQDFGVERARRVASAGIRALWDTKVRSVAVAFDSGLDDRTAVRAGIEGASYAMFRPEALRTQERLRHLPPLATVSVVVADPKAVAAEVERADIVGQAVNLVRRLSNTPANQMTPRILADEAAALANDAKLKAEVLDEKQAARLGMNSFLSVSRGSHEPPRFIVLRHDGRDGTGYDLAVVGKGITFDSGGISLKDPEGMHLMKGDMTGGAVALATVWALARAGAKLNVLGIVPATENLPGGGATKPGDVVTSMGGKTIEVINTDAEGRLVLVDGVTYALRQGARRVVTVATLTGSIVVALGNHLTGVFGKPEDFVGDVISASKRAGEKMWPMPITPEHRLQIQSDIADIKNTGGRPGGACTAAAFIEAHVDDGKLWAHLDIAGTFWAENDTAYAPKGPQGPAVPTLVALAESLAG
jgi:leucyl aminopeptidase